MNNKDKDVFSTPGDQFNSTQNLGNLFHIVTELNRITKLIHTNFRQLCEICYCGALDYEDNLLIVYVKNNSAFYIVNGMARAIQDVLSKNNIHFNKLLIKVRPLASETPKPKHRINFKQYQMLEKFARATNREDLLKPFKDDAEKDDDLWPI